MAPKWIWLLKDPDGNVATEIEDTGTGPEVAAQRAYDPYGSPDLGGSAIAGDISDLGFQSDLTDQDTGNLLLGPRIYDPRTDRFTTADFFVGASSDLALGTDPLTGNRYVFAAANPVGFYENGYSPMCDGDCGRSYSMGPAPRDSNPLNLLAAAVGMVSDFARGARYGTSGISLAWRWGDTPEVRSAAAGLIREAGRLTKFVEKPLFKAFSSAAVGLNVVVDYNEYRNSEPTFEALTRSSTQERRCHRRCNRRRRTLRGRRCCRSTNTGHNNDCRVRHGHGVGRVSRRCRW